MQRLRLLLVWWIIFTQEKWSLTALLVEDDCLQIHSNPCSRDESIEEGGLKSKGFDTTFDDEVIVVSTVAGDIVGLSRKTGDALWRHNGKMHNKANGYKRNRGDRPDGKCRLCQKMEGNSVGDEDANADILCHGEDIGRLLAPLVSTSTTTKTSSSGLHTAAVPSVDGRIYLTPGREAASPTTGSASDANTGASIRDIVDRSPFVDAHGKFYVGSRQSTAAALDRDTGEILRLVKGEGNESEDDDSAQRRNDAPDLEGRNVVWLGRVDNSVTVYDARTGEVDVMFAASEILSIGDMIGAYVLPQDRDLGESSPFADPFASAPLEQPSPSLLLATPGGHLAMRDIETGLVAWVSSEFFDAPVAFAVGAQSGTSLGVDIVPDAPMPSSSLAYLTEQFQRQIAAMNHLDEIPDGGSTPMSPGGDAVRSFGKTIVGAMNNGELFALPLGRSVTPKRPATQMIGMRRQNSHPAAVRSYPGRQPLMISPVGRHQQLQELSQQAAHYVSDHQLVSARKCVPSSSTYPACLVGLSENIVPRTHVPEEEANFYLPGYTDLESAEFKGERRRSHFRTFIRIMTSWIPPTVALAFVISFEFGRRERLKAEILSSSRTGKAETTTKNAGAVSDGNEISVKDSDGGLIKVSDEILGYGAHGTVVYRGQLAGRNVAVKRMLKAYHASAEREISLLIESDGHPNVVRYFLKEVRGDFVFLALELCDCTLQDLIHALCRKARLSHVSKPNGEQSSPHTISLEDKVTAFVWASTKKALFQIASGVRHLHSLRIVHRDLKPQNILLALRNGCDNELWSIGVTVNDEHWQEAACRAFRRDQFVPKISDMGLGKQLAGQSSFGISTLGNTSAGVDVGVERKNLAGPGSVGWQAPEVMAMRWPSDTPVDFDSDSNGVQTTGEGLVVVKRTSRSVDIFSLGCIFYCTLVPGTHPFGEWYEREGNIMKGKPSTKCLEKVSVEAHDLVNRMLSREPEARPTAVQVCNHPFFWKPSKKLSFLCELSDRVEVECTVAESNTRSDDNSQVGVLAFNIEKNASKVIGLAWDRELDAQLLDNVSRFRTYDPSSVRDCLRLIRNKCHHYDELPQDFKSKIGSSLDDLLHYFERKFPRLLMHCYNVCKAVFLEKDSFLLKYCIWSQRNRVDHRESEEAASAEPKASACLETKTEYEEDIRIPEKEMQFTASTSTGMKLKDQAACEGELVVTSRVLEQSAQSSNPFAALESRESNGFPADEVCDDEQPNSLKISVSDHLIDANDETVGMVIWEGSNSAKLTNCRGWMRSEDDWKRRTDAVLRKRDVNVTRCAVDPKYRTRLCNHWDASEGTFCPMKKKNKCIFAHGPVELRVKEGKRHRWGTLVDKDGNNSNPCNSGGEDTYGAARSIETVRKEEGKWNTDRKHGRGRGKGRKKKQQPT